MKNNMKNNFFWGQKIFFAAKFDELKFFEIKEMSIIKWLIRLTDPDKGIGALYSLKTGEFSFIKFCSYYTKWERTDFEFVAISTDENEVMRKLANQIILKEKKEIEDLQKKILASWDTIMKANKYL